MNIIKEANKLGFERNGHLGYVIFESLPNIDYQAVASHIVSMFPSTIEVSDFKPFKQHLHTSFMRKLFGLSDRNGVLLSITHPNRSEGLASNCCRSQYWDHVFDFVQILEDEFLKQKKHFGLILLNEALGHRYGDLYTLSEDKEDKEEYRSRMEDHYWQSFRLAKDIKCVKQIYVVWYWLGCYYYKNGENDQVKQNLVRFLNNFGKYQDHARVVPVEKIKIAFKILRNICSIEEYNVHVTVNRKRSRGKYHQTMKNLR